MSSTFQDELEPIKRFNNKFPREFTKVVEICNKHSALGSHPL